MDNTVTGTRRQDDDTPHYPSPLNVISKSTSISQSGSHRATTGPTPQVSSSYATMDMKTLSDERLNGAAGASPAVMSEQFNVSTNILASHFCA